MDVFDAAEHTVKSVLVIAGKDYGAIVRDWAAKVDHGRHNWYDEFIFSFDDILSLSPP